MNPNPMNIPRYNPNLPGVKRDFYTYPVTTIGATPVSFGAGIAPGANQSTQLLIEADSDFTLQKLSYTACNVAAAAGTTFTNTLVPNVGVLLTDTGSSRQLMKGPVPIPCLFGTGQLPFILPNPRTFTRNSSITVALFSYEPGGGTTYFISLSFIGFKVYGTT